MKLRELLAKQRTNSQRAQKRATVAFRLNQSVADLDLKHRELTKEIVTPETFAFRGVAAETPVTRINRMLRELRRAARLTQLELAQRTGISRVRLSQAECGYLGLSEIEWGAVHSAIEQEFYDRAKYLTDQLSLLSQGSGK